MKVLFKSKNILLEWIKFIAACFVVFIHKGFPGNLGMAIESLARFGVPVFFAISGYYSLGIDDKRIARRLWRLIKITIFANLIYIFYGCWSTKYVEHASRLVYLREKLSLKNVCEFLILNTNPFAGHLWYLNVIIICYVMLWVYMKFYEGKKCNYSPLYIVSVSLMCMHIILSSGLKCVGIDLPYILVRNAVLMGIPMFALGLFIREYQEIIVEKLRLNLAKEIAIIILGSIMAIVERFGVGKEEIHMGTMLVVVSILILAVTNPIYATDEKSLLNISGVVAGKLSLIVYIIHIMVSSILVNLANTNDFVQKIIERKMYYPVVVLFLSIICGFIWIFIEYVVILLGKKFLNK